MNTSLPILHLQSKIKKIQNALKITERQKYVDDNGMQSFWYIVNQALEKETSCYAEEFKQSEVCEKVQLITIENIIRKYISLIISDPNSEYTLDIQRKKWSSIEDSFCINIQWQDKVDAYHLYIGLKVFAFTEANLIRDLKRTVVHYKTLLGDAESFEIRKNYLNYSKELSQKYRNNVYDYDHHLLVHPFYKLKPYSKIKYCINISYLEMGSFLARYIRVQENKCIINLDVVNIDVNDSNPSYHALHSIKSYVSDLESPKRLALMIELLGAELYKMNGDIMTISHERRESFFGTHVLPAFERYLKLEGEERTSLNYFRKKAGINLMLRKPNRLSEHQVSDWINFLKSLEDDFSGKGIDDFIDDFSSVKGFAILQKNMSEIALELYDKDTSLKNCLSDPSIAEIDYFSSDLFYGKEKRGTIEFLKFCRSWNEDGRYLAIKLSTTTNVLVISENFVFLTLQFYLSSTILAYDACKIKGLPYHVRLTASLAQVAFLFFQLFELKPKSIISKGNIKEEYTDIAEILGLYGPSEWFLEQKYNNEIFEYDKGEGMIYNPHKKWR